MLLRRKNKDVLIGTKLNIGMNYHILKVVVLTGDQELSQEVVNDKQKELENLSTNDVYEAVMRIRKQYLHIGQLQKNSKMDQGKLKPVW